MSASQELEKSFAFYLSYHNNRINQYIHILCVWPILFTAQILLAYTPSFSDYIPVVFAPIQLFFGKNTLINFNLLFTLRYAVFYSYVEQPGIAGIIATALVVAGYFVSSSIIQTYENIWIYALSIHIFCWLAQFYGHGVHEKRAPALLDNLTQALIMAPLFIIMELLFVLGYKKEFQIKTQKLANEKIREFKQLKK